MCPSPSLNNWGLCISSWVCWRQAPNEFQSHHKGAYCELYTVCACTHIACIAEHVLCANVWGSINSVYTTGLPDITEWIIHLSSFCLCLSAVPIDSTASIKMLYVFVDIQMDNAHFLDTVKFNFSPGQSLALVSTIQFVAALQVMKYWGFVSDRAVVEWLCNVNNYFHLCQYFLFCPCICVCAV